MTIDIINNGSNNIININENFINNGSGKILIEGSNNFINIDHPMIFGNLNITVSGKASVTLGRDIVFPVAGILHITCRKGGSVKIGDTTKFNGSAALRADEGSFVEVGNDCLFADAVKVWTSDFHSVVDLKTGQRINPPRGVVIGNHVWIGEDVKILKGAKIEDNSVIGCNSVVSRTVPKNCVAAGNPARIVKQNISWDIELLEITQKPKKAWWSSFFQ